MNMSILRCCVMRASPLCCTVLLWLTGLAQAGANQYNFDSLNSGSNTATSSTISESREKTKSHFDSDYQRTKGNYEQFRSRANSVSATSSSASSGSSSSSSSGGQKAAAAPRETKKMEIKDSGERAYRNAVVYSISCPNGKSYKLHQGTEKRDWTTTVWDVSFPGSSHRSLESVAQQLCN